MLEEQRARGGTPPAPKVHVAPSPGSPGGSFAGSCRRGHRRHAVDLITEIRRSAGMRRTSSPARVVDLSQGGVRVEVAQPLSPGEWVTVVLPRAVPSQGGELQLVLPSGRVRAQVRGDPERVSGDGRFSVGLAFARGLRSRLAHRLDSVIPWLALSALVAVLIPIVRLKQVNVHLFWYHPIANAYGLLVTAYILSRIVLAFFYRPPRDTGHRPGVTVVVACKNEAAAIRRTLECIFRSDYPAEKLEVIAVDDGSTDRTLEEMRKVEREHPSLRIISFERNRGKRHAMAEGARLATGEVLVYVDSDSFLRPDAVRKLASAFADEEVAAVCGHADVQNSRESFLTKMQEVRYYTAFRVVKAAESLFSAVTCCSGCLAAYRRRPVMEVLDHWLEQKFLGVPATFGDDRSLTRLMLKRHRVIYHSEAVCTTIVPSDWRVFFRQQLRWKKSWIRENLLLSAFMWKRNPLMVASFYLSVVFPLVSPGIVLHALALPLVGIGTFSFLYVYGAVLMASLYALVYLARRRNALWVYGVWFSLFYMVALVWQTYYALATIRRNHWGTR
jgi:hyaluronan synthase